MDNHIVKVRQGGVVSLWSLPSICSFGLSHNPPQWRIVWQAERISAYSLTTRLVSCFNVWVPRLAYNGLPVDARSFEEFGFVFVFFVFLTAGLRCHLFSWLEPWCESHKLSYNLYCIVACLVGKRWWIHTVSALCSSLQADCQLPLDLCIVLSTNIMTVWKTSLHYFFPHLTNSKTLVGKLCTIINPI